MASQGLLSTAEERRAAVVDAAVTAFAATGYLGTPVTTVARGAGISTAYVFKLFPRKEELFVAALDRCFDLVVQALEQGGATSASREAGAVLAAMGDAYAHLVADEALLMMQVHAQSAAAVPEIGAALRRGLQRVVATAGTSGADDEAVQRFVAYGQLCHLVVTTRLGQEDAHWARALSAGIQHF